MLKVRLLQTALLLTTLAPGVASAAGLAATFVSGSGDDTQACTRSAPCRTFAGAIAKTAPYGVITPLDSADYGRAVITASMTIDATGVNAVATQGNQNDAVFVNAGPTDFVRLVNLNVVGNLAVNSTGVSVLQAGNFELLNSRVSNFVVGILVATSSALKFSIINTISSGNSFHGLGVQPNGNQSPGVYGEVKGSTFEGNGFYGIFAVQQPKLALSVRDSSLLSNTKSGIILGAGKVSLTNVNASFNGENGVNCSGTCYLTKSMLIGNVGAPTSGQVNTLKDNLIDVNVNLKPYSGQ